MMRFWCLESFPALALHESRAFEIAFYNSENAKAGSKTQTAPSGTPTANNNTI